MANDVTLTCRLNKTHLPVMNTQQLVYVLIDAVPGASMAQVKTPVNLSLVLDKSGSMQGKKIQNLRSAAKMVVDRLGPDDTISIVAFSDRKYLIASSQPVKDKEGLKKKIDRIRDGGGTAISGGMNQGLSELRKATSPDRVSRMLLLTDGQTFGDEKKCKKLAKEAGDQGVAVMALGLGDDWNEDLLDEIAAGSGGVADFIDTPDKIVAVFDQAVQSMQDTVVQNADMVLRLANGVTPRQVWQVLPMISNLGYQPLSDRDVQVTLGEIEKGQSRSLLVELLVGPRQQILRRIQDLTFTDLRGFQQEIAFVDNRTRGHRHQALSFTGKQFWALLVLAWVRDRYFGGLLSFGFRLGFSHDIRWRFLAIAGLRLRFGGHIFFFVVKRWFNWRFRVKCFIDWLDLAGYLRPDACYFDVP